jgi:hypothetical protein
MRKKYTRQIELPILLFSEAGISPYLDTTVYPYIEKALIDNGVTGWWFSEHMVGKAPRDRWGYCQVHSIVFKDHLDKMMALPFVTEVAKSTLGLYNEF